MLHGHVVPLPVLRLLTSNVALVVSHFQWTPLKVHCQLLLHEREMHCTFELKPCQQVADQQAVKVSRLQEECLKVWVCISILALCSLMLFSGIMDKKAILFERVLRHSCFVKKTVATLTFSP